MAFSPQKDAFLQLGNLRLNDATKNVSYVAPKNLEEEVFLDINDQIDSSFVSKEPKEGEVSPSAINESEIALNLRDPVTRDETCANEVVSEDLCITKREDINELENNSNQEIDTAQEETIPQLQANALENNVLGHQSKEMRIGSTVIPNEEVHIIGA